VNRPGRPKQPNLQAFRLFDERGYRTYRLTEILHLRVLFGRRSGAILAGLWRLPHHPMRADCPEQSIDFVAGRQAVVS
jgi:hypothetical protein